MTRSRVAVALLLAGGVAVIAFRPWAEERPPLPDRPVCEYPRRLDLRDLDPYTATFAVVPVRNAGTGPLVLDQIRSDCSCHSVEVRRAVGTSTRVGGLVEVAPGETVELILSLTPRGLNGLPPFTSLAFVTNDPTAAAVTVSVGIGCKPALLADPPVLVFGDVLVGQTGTRTARLSSPSGSTAPLSILLDDPRFAATIREDGADRLLDVRARGESPGAFECGITVVDDRAGKPVARLAAKGRFAEPIELSADTLYLPRGSSKGLVYEGVVTVTGVGGDVTVRVPAVPVGFTATAGDGRVTIRRTEPETLTAESRTAIPLELTAGSLTVTRTVTVVVSPPRTNR